MTDVQLADARPSIRKAVAPRAAEPSDGQLLVAFAAENDPGAFSRIVRRHGPAVLGVCRRVLGHMQDAEDAFQATFLVLAKKAGSVRRGESLAGWLHGVAYRVAMRAKRDAARRRKHERQAPAATIAPPGGVVDWREVQAVLDEEIDRLPPAYRAAFVLCCLSGLSQADAARQLGVPEGTVSSRLTRARKRLQDALTRRGLTLTAVLGALALTGGTRAAVPEALADTTARAMAACARGATHGLSAQVLTLAEGALQTMFTTKMKLAAALVLALGLLAAGATALRQQDASAGEPAASLAIAAEPPAKPPADPVPPVKPGAERDSLKTVLIAGKVLGPDGKPHAGARLYLHTRGKPEPEPRAVTGEDGRFRLTLSAKALTGGATVIVRADGLGPDWFRVGPGTGGERTMRLVKDDVPITGRVLDLEGRPVAGATVRAGSVEARRGGGNLDPWVNHWKKYSGKSSYPPEALRLPVKMKEIGAEALGLGSTTTDKEGRFRLTGFGRERVVRVQIAGEGIATTWLHVATRPRPETPPLTYFRNAAFQAIVGPGKSIVGVLRERGTDKPAVGVIVTCGVGRTTTDEKGRFRINGLEKREHHFVGMYGPRTFFTLTEVADTPGLETIRFKATIDRGILVRGKVTDKETGRPLSASLQFIARADNPHLADNPDFSVQGTIPSSGRARQDGTYRLPAIPGKGWLCVVADDEERYQGPEYEDAGLPILTGIPRGYHPSRFHAVIPITLDPAKDTVTIDVALQPGARRVGKLMGPDGKPVKGAYPAGLRPISSKDGRFNPCEPLAGATFTALGLDPERPRPAVFYHLERKLGKVTRLEVGKGPQVVTLDPMGAVAGRLLGEDGKPLAGAHVQARLPRRFNAYEELPHELMQNHKAKLKVVVQTDAEGRFRIEGLVPELPYDLVWNDGEIRRGVRVYAIRENVSVGPGKTKDLGDVRTRPRR
jgi:RNA polymerase sigma factor (sigma-70 family)